MTPYTMSEIGMPHSEVEDLAPYQYDIWFFIWSFLSGHDFIETPFSGRPTI